MQVVGQDLLAFGILEFFSSVFLGDIGESTWMYLPAVVLRVVILYMFAFVLLRLMGKRENKQLTMFDAVVIVILGDLIGTPTIDFQLPIILAMLALGVFITLERVFIVLIQHSQRLENLIESKPALLVEDGKVNSGVLKKEKLGTDELYSSLRSQGIENLGNVKRAYLESSGSISVFKSEKKKNGLSILPPMIGAPPHHSANSVVIETSDYYCWNCGESKKFPKDSTFTSCPRCQGKDWVSEDNSNQNSGDKCE